MSKNSYTNLLKNKADKLNTVRFDHENEDETVTLSYYDGEEWRELSNLGSGGGNTGSLGKGSITSTFDKKVVQSDEEVIIDYFYNSPNGNGVLYVMLNNSQYMKENIGEGSGEINLGCLPKGTNIVRIYVIDKAGTYTDALQYSISCGTLEITCGFNADRDYYPESNIVFQFNVECVNNEPITYHITQNGKEITEPYTVSKGWNAFTFPKYGPGVYRVDMWCTTASYTSNKVSFVVYILAGDSIFISTTFDKEEVPEGEIIKFDYRISMRDQDYFDCVYYIDNIERKRGRVRSGTDYWNITDLSMGSHIIRITATTVDAQYSTELEYEILITESEYNLVKPVTKFIKAWFDGSSKSNSDSNKETWISKYPDINGEYATATLHGFNFSSNGWIDDKLKCDGNSYVEVDLTPFANNVSTGGLTIDILFETADVGNQDARVIDCTDLTTVAGCFIDTQYAHIDTKGGTTLKSAFSENTLTRVTFVVDRDSTYISKEEDEAKNGKELPNPMVQIYVNAVLSEIGFLSDTISGSSIYFENIDHDQKLYINSRKGIDSFGSCSIRHLRIYDCALTHEEVLTNHIADIEDPLKQQEEYRINFDDENPAMPVMYINSYGSMNPAYDISKVTKSNKIPVSISYQAIDKHGGSSFELDYCLLQWQGTSTLQYAVKNYKISLYENNSVPIIKKEDSNEEYDKFDFDKEKAVKYKYQLFGDESIGEYKYTLKADYMDSAMCNNTGMASFIGGNLYDSKVPPAVYDSRIRSCCKGYPFLLYIDGEYAGIYNFMIDKGAEDTFGFKRPKDKVNKDEWEENFPCILGYEGAANSDNTAGAFNAWNPDRGVDLNTWYASDFELRYPEDEHDSYEEVHRLVNFVDNSSDEEFVRDFEKYINKEYCLRYFINAYMMGCVDSLGKNMMMSTWDGKVWYFCWYDMDTCLGLDNSGYLKFESDVEMEAGVYNTSGSRLWTRVKTLLFDDLKAEWKKMRDINYTFDRFYDYFYNRQISLIGTRHYNKNIYAKYIPFYKQYSHMIHGNRLEHMKRWVKERFIYLDSYFGYESEEIKSSVTIRVNKSNGSISPMSISLKTYSPQYVKIRWRNGLGANGEPLYEQTKRVGRNQTVTFTMDMPDVTDQEVLIFNAPQLKDIGDLTDLNPSVLLVSNARKLTSLTCRNSSLLTKVELTANTMMQSIDLSGCTGLGSDQSGTTLDVSSCSNLKYLNVYDTSLLSVTTDVNGGNIEEIYYPYTTQSIRLVRQTNLKTLGIPYSIIATSHYNYTSNKYCNNLTELYIEECPYLESIGINRGTKKDFDDKNMISLSNVRDLTIKNSMNNVTEMDFSNCKGLVSLSINDMYNLEVLKLNDLQYHYNIEPVYNFKTLNLYNCPKLHTLEMSSYMEYEGFRPSCVFAKGTTIDLSRCVALTTIKSNYGIEGLERIILPSSIKNLIFEGSIERVSDLTSMYVEGKHDQSFVGIDLDGLELEDFCMESLVKVPQLLNLNLVAHKYPIAINMIRDNSTYPYIIPEAIIDLNEYTGTSLRGLYKGITSLEDNNFLVLIDDDKYLDKVTDADSMFCDSDIDEETIKNLYSKLFNIKNASKLFKNNKNILSLDEYYASIINAEEMFSGCSSLRNASFTISNITENCKKMFYNCKALKTCPESIPDSVLDCEQMFFGCNALTKGPSYIGSNVQTCKQMFSDCYEMIEVFNNIPDSCTTCYYMFTNCEKLVIGPVILEESYSNLETCQRMFYNCKALQYGPDVIPNRVTTCQDMFNGCSSLIEGPTILSNNLTNCISMFNGCSSMTTVPRAIPDYVTSCSSMFEGCTSITDAPASFGSSLNNLNFMFKNSGIRSCPDLPLNANYAQGCFEGCINLIKAPELPNAVSALAMFSGCTSLIETPSIIPNTYNNLQNMFSDCVSLETVKFSTVPGSANAESGGCKYMFSGCIKLKSGPTIIENGVLDVSDMFRDCVSLEATPLSIGDSVNNLSSMFSGCTSLETVQFTIPASAKNLNNMFENCSALIQGPSKLNLALESCNRMYTGCTSLSVPSEFASGSALVTDCGYMYYNTAIATSPYIPSSVKVANYMFAGCKSLITVTNNAVNAGPCNGFLGGCISLTTIKDLNFTNYETISSSFFTATGNCSNLTNITFTDPTGNGSIKSDLNLGFTDLLTTATLDTLVAALERKSGTSNPAKLTLSQKVYDRLTSSHRSVIASKNWTINVQ